MMPCAARPNSGPCVGHKRHTGKEEMIALYGVRVSQWSMTYFAGAWISLALAEMVWMSGLAKPLSNIGSSWVLIGVHLTTLSFLTLLMIGALNQFVPVLTQTELASQRLSGITFVLTVIGVAGMIAGFLSLPATISGALFKSIPWLLPTGGSLVVLGLVVGVINLGITVKRAWPWALPTWFVSMGLFFLLVTIVVGLVLAFSLAFPALFSSHQLLVIGGRGLASHVVGGIGGWFTLSAMGVSYKLLAMFTLSPEHDGIQGWIALVATALGIGVVWVSRWVNARAFAQGGWALIVLGLVVYLADIMALYRRRKRRNQLELNARYARIALSFLAAIILIALSVRPTGRLLRIDIVLVFLALYGWLGGFALTQLYKIVPFLTWIRLFGHRMGKGRTPRVQDLVNESRDRYAFILYFFSIAMAAIFLQQGWTLGFRGMMFLAFIATLDIGRALYHAAHPLLPLNETRRPHGTETVIRRGS